MFWWVELGYPDAFEMGKGGFPKAGQVIKYYREKTMDHEGKPYTQAYLAKVLGISDHAVREIENKEVGIDYDRRQFLTKLFNIPPILLGVVTIEQINELLAERGVSPFIVSPVEPSRSPSHINARKDAINSEEYDTLLTRLWESDPYSGTAFGDIALAQLAIDAFYHELPHVTAEELPHLYKLLCGYHQFVGNTLRDQEDYAGAVVHLNKALRFAELLENNHLRALVLHRKAIALEEAGDMVNAALAYQQAHQLEGELPLTINGAITLHSGLVGAISATTQKQKDDAINLCDVGGNLIRSNQSKDDPHFLKLNLDRYHLNKGSALIAIGRNKDAIHELKLVRCGSKQIRRKAYCGILEAQAYTNLGKYDRAAGLAEFALLIAQQINSKVNIARVVRIFQQLQQSSYKKSPDVARLEYLLYYKPRT
jgi:tetratricopeptide (TPR) repeat protein/DNA-binding XRE family transcriptional regulator